MHKLTLGGRVKLSNVATPRLWDLFEGDSTLITINMFERPLESWSCTISHTASLFVRPNAYNSLSSLGYTFVIRVFIRLYAHHQSFFGLLIFLWPMFYDLHKLIVEVAANINMHYLCNVSSLSILPLSDLHCLAFIILSVFLSSI